MSQINVDPKVLELLNAVHEVIEPMGIDYAIGGALAMAAAGYARHTKDVDLFVTERDRHKVLIAFRRAGYTVSPVFDPHHYAVYLPGDIEDPDVRIDVMIPAGEPDLSAISYPSVVALTKGGDTFNVVEPNLLAVMKYLSDREKDDDDLKAMFRHGTFDPVNVRAIVVYLAGDDPADVAEAGAEYDARIESFRAKRRSSKPKVTRGYVPPGRGKPRGEEE